MGIINIDDVRAGMILAQTVSDRRGRVLLGPGCRITEKHLRILRMWGITEADIEGVEREEVMAKATAELDPGLRQRAEAEARHLFRNTNFDDPAIHELLRLCTLRRARRMASGGRHGL